MPLDDGLGVPFDAGLPFSIPLDWKGLPIMLFLELMGLMLSLLPFDTDLPLLYEPVLSRPPCTQQDSGCLNTKPLCATCTVRHSCILTLLLLQSCYISCVACLCQPAGHPASTIKTFAGLRFIDHAMRGESLGSCPLCLLTLFQAHICLQQQSACTEPCSHQASSTSIERDMRRCTTFPSGYEGSAVPLRLTFLGRPERLDLAG